jgi:hypothetical protein
MIEDIRDAIKTVLEGAGYTVEPFYKFDSDYFQAKTQPEDYPVAFIFGATQYTFEDSIKNSYDQSTPVGIKLVHYSGPTDYPSIFDTAKREFQNLVYNNIRLTPCVHDWSINQMDIKAISLIDENSPSPCYLWDVITTVDFIENGVA